MTCSNSDLSDCVAFGLFLFAKFDVSSFLSYYTALDLVLRPGSAAGRASYLVRMQ